MINNVFFLYDSESRMVYSFIYLLLYTFIYLFLVHDMREAENGSAMYSMLTEHEQIYAVVDVAMPQV